MLILSQEKKQSIAAGKCTYLGPHYRQCTQPSEVPQHRCFTNHEVQKQERWVIVETHLNECSLRLDLESEGIRYAR